MQQNDPPSAALYSVPLLHAMLDNPQGIHRDMLCTLCACHSSELSAQLDNLQRIGCVLQQHPQGEIVLQHVPLCCYADALQADWQHGSIHIFRQTASTQDIALRMLKEPSQAHSPSHHQSGSIVIADHQSAGRGRLGRRWQSAPDECLLLSLLWPVPNNAQLLPLGLPVAVLRTLQRHVSTTTQLAIKWPNDVVVRNSSGLQKIAGILVEQHDNHAICGIGLNVHLNQHTIDQARGLPPASLHQLGRPVERLQLARHLLQNLSQTLEQIQHDPSSIIQTWRHHCVQLGGHATFSTPQGKITGEVLDVDTQHGLLVRTQNGQTIALSAAHTTMLEMA